MKRAAAAASLCLYALCLAATLSASSRQAVADDGANSPLAIVVNHANPVDDLTFAELRRIFTLETQKWPNGRKITVVLREKGQPERDDAIRIVCGMSPAQYNRHILYETFRGSIGSGPRSIESAGAMLRFVFNAPGAIGYVPANQVDGTTKVLRIGGLLPADPGYPLRRSARVP